MYCISVNYKKASEDFRSLLVFPEDKQREFMTTLRNSGVVSEIVILCTCNRTEVYFCGNGDSPAAVEQTLADFSSADRSELSQRLFFYYNEKAVYHLFKVVSGIDSMVIGEDEILGQTKRAYKLACDVNSVGYEMNMCFQAAFACAKKIKTETLISKTSVSTATLAANEIARMGDNVRVLVIGAGGSIGSTLVKNLASHKNIKITATVRDNHSVADFCGKIINYEQRYLYANDADCIVSATKSPHYTLTFGELAKNLTTEKNRVLIDLAVPPDIDRKAASIKGVSLITIDRFEMLARENNALKMDSVSSAKKMIEEAVDTLLKDMVFHDFLPKLKRMREGLNKISLEELLYKFKSELSAEEFKSVVNILAEFGKE